MSTLRVRVDKPLEFEGGRPPRVFASIQRVNDRGRSVAQTLEHVLVPISSDPKQSKVIKLSPGNYTVEVKLPSGELLSDAVRVAEGSEQNLVLMAKPLARPSLTSRHLAGNVAQEAELVSKSAYRAAIRSETSQLARSPDRRDTSSFRVVSVPLSMSERLPGVLQRVGLSMADGVIGPLNTKPRTPWEPGHSAKIDILRPLHWLGGGEAKLGVDVLRGDPWRALSEMRGSTANILEVLNAGRTEYFVEPTASNDVSAVFPVPNRSTPGTSAFAPPHRNYVAVHRRMGVELVCLPTPWVEQTTGREVAVEICVQRPRFETEFASAVAVRDQQLAILLGFLSSGALPAAKRLAETAGGMLYEKNQNPLAAAAGGYALVSSAVDTQHQRWHVWIENLMRRFEHVPDGAIQYGTMRLRLRTCDNDITEATRAFKLAYRQGLPFFGIGLRWLLEGLQRVGARDDEARVMAESVQKLTARLHPQSPFTILRIGRQ